MSDLFLVNGVLVGVINASYLNKQPQNIYQWFNTVKSSWLAHDQILSRSPFLCDSGILASSALCFQFPLLFP